MNGDFYQKTGFGRSRVGRHATGAAMNLGVGPAFEGQPDLLRMIEIAQRAQQGELVKALHEQYRVLLCAPMGVAPGDKEWPEAHKRVAGEKPNDSAGGPDQAVGAMLQLWRFGAAHRGWRASQC